MSGALPKVFGVVVLVAALAASNPALGLSAQIVLAAESLEAEGGRFGGNLVALLQGNTGEAEPLAGATFTLHAQHLRVEVDYADPAVRAEDANAGYLAPNAAQESPRDYRAATVSGLENRPGHRWMLRPAGGGASVDFDAGCLSYDAPAKDNVSRPAFLNPAHSFNAELSAAVQATSCRQGTAVVVGDFCLSLWEWDVEVRGTEGAEVLRSGSQPSQVAPVGGDYLRELREVFLCAEGARLTLPLSSGTHELYVEDARVEDASTLKLDAARGDVRVGSHALSLDGEDVELHGSNLAADVSRSGNGVQVRVAGDVDAMRVAGNEVFVAPDPGFDSRWMWAFTILVLPAFVWWWRLDKPQRRLARGGDLGSFTPQGRRGRRAGGFFLLSEEDLVEGRLDAADKHADSALKLEPSFREAWGVKGFVAMLRQEHEKAVRIFDAIHPHLPQRERAEVALAATTAYLRLRQPRDAVARLKLVARDNPDLFQSELDKPIYDALLFDSWFRSARGCPPEDTFV